jgi:hypothetical protein
MGVLGQLGVQVANGMGVTITSDQVQSILKEAILLCPDYYVPVQEAITGVIANRGQLIR